MVCGYCRLTSTGWGVLSESMKFLPGPTIEYNQTTCRPEELDEVFGRFDVCVGLDDTFSEPRVVVQI